MDWTHEQVFCRSSLPPWHWLADPCACEQIAFILGPALYMKAIHGGKAKSNKIDSEKIARLIKGGTFPLAYTYPPELRLYIQGGNCCGLSEYYRPLPGLYEWIRLRLRMCYLKQWRKPCTRIRNLIKLGTRTRTAVSLGLSSKGPYCLAGVVTGG